MLKNILNLIVVHRQVFLKGGSSITESLLYLSFVKSHGADLPLLQFDQKIFE